MCRRADPPQPILYRGDHARGVHHDVKAPGLIEVISTRHRLGRPKLDRLFAPGLVRLDNRYRSGADPLANKSSIRPIVPAP